MGMQPRTGTTAGVSAELSEQPQHGSPQPPAGIISRVILMPVQRQGQDDMVTEQEISGPTEAAQLLGIASRTTIWEAYKRGEIRGRKQGRKGTIKIPHSALVEYAIRFNYPVPPSPRKTDDH